MMDTTNGLLGTRVKIDVPSRFDSEEEAGTVTGLAIPLVRVEVGPDAYYRHIDDVTLARRSFPSGIANDSSQP